LKDTDTVDNIPEGQEAIGSGIARDFGKDIGVSLTLSLTLRSYRSLEKATDGWCSHSAIEAWLKSQPTDVFEKSQAWIDRSQSLEASRLRTPCFLQLESA
jgi:hypothetical protein